MYGNVKIYENLKKYYQLGYENAWETASGRCPGNTGNMDHWLQRKVGGWE